MKGHAFMRFLEAEPAFTLKPYEFDGWMDELGDVADEAGAWALIGCFWHASEECCRYLVANPTLWQGLLARAQFADKRRYESGVMLGRRMGA